MVDGLNIKYSVMLIPATMFFYATAIMNPVIILKCQGHLCRERMHSPFDEFDEDIDDFSSYEKWRVSNTTNLQSDGVVTLLKFSHGYVKCDSNCDDCAGWENASDTCKDYNDTEYQSLLDTLQRLSEEPDSSSFFELPSYLQPNCSCKDWCEYCDESNLVSLPGDNGKHRHTQNYWNELQKNCEKWEEQFESDKDEMCNLFSAFTVTMKLTIVGFTWLLAVLVLMMFMEYTNFHIFYKGKCKFCFRTPLFKKILFTVLLTAPVAFMMVTMAQLRYGRTEELLDEYFKLVGDTKFVYDWETRGILMFGLSMASALLSIVVMMMSGTKERHLRTVINYRRGVEYEGVDWKPHVD
jgi:hypothetical protein